MSTHFHALFKSRPLSSEEPNCEEVPSSVTRTEPKPVKPTGLTGSQGLPVQTGFVWNGLVPSRNRPIPSRNQPVPYKTGFIYLFIFYINFFVRLEK
jgi:hypothetical protein